MFKFKKNFLFLVLIFLFLIYNCVFIYKRSFVIDGVRYFSLCDDMMVSMRYAKNLTHGYGLVWNPGGERVEGYTNLLWVLYMSIFHLLPIPAAKISLFIQLSGVIFLAINLYVVKKMVETLFNKSNNSYFISLTAVFLTASYYPLNNWAVAGTEVSILTLLVSIIVLLILRSLKFQKPSNILYFLLGLTTLIRIDMTPLSLILILFLVYINKKNRKKHLTTGLTVILFSLFIQTLFRIIYYHDVLPNTYYLKMVGYPTLLRITNGVYVFLRFVWQMNLFLFLLPFLLLFDKRIRHHLSVLYITLAAQIIYSVYVGGDTYEVLGGSNRFISIVMPLFFILLSISLFKMKSILSSFLNNNLLINTFLSVGVLLSLVSLNNIKSSGLIDYWLLLKEPLYGAKDNIQVARVIEKISKRNAIIAVAWAGTVPYFTDRYYIDVLGKNDKIVGREKMKMSSEDKFWKYFRFFPGHMKWDYQYSISQTKPDIVIIMYENYNIPFNKQAEPYLNKLYKKIKIRNHGIYIKSTKKILNTELVNS